MELESHPRGHPERRLRGGAERPVTDHARALVLDPGERCPDCGGALRLVGEDVAEILDFIAAS